MTRLAATAMAFAVALAACTSPAADAEESPADPVSTSTTTTTTPPTEPTSTTTTTTSVPTPPVLDLAGSPIIEFSVEVGDVVELDRDELAHFVVDTLGDPRSWGARGVGFRLVDEGGLFTLVVAAPDDVDRMCAPLRTNGRFSCARNGWVALNSLRWFGATDEWPADLDTYRRYLVNHEVGHYVEGAAHGSCPGPGLPAPIMMPQTKGLDGCVATGWVEPEAAPPE